jgi:FeS assembly SUF system regulator
MLRLSKKTDYALIALAHLAQRGATGAGAFSAREIAEEYAIPAELMAKVLQRLARRGLLTSQQGTHGGYQLARPASTITVVDVIQAIDGPLSVTACSAQHGRCGQLHRCIVRAPLLKIRERIVDALAGCSVLELLGGDEQADGATAVAADGARALAGAR